jgi:hypothetical protein
MSAIHLVDLSLYSGRNVLNFDDATLEQLGAALPSLEKLRLDCVYSEMWILPNATLSGVFALLRFCRNLNDLAIAINASDPPYFRLPSVNLPITVLQHLNLLESPVDNALYVAEIFSTVFPALETLGHRQKPSGGYTSDHIVRWNMVWRVQTTLRRARKDEQLRASRKVGL